MSGDSVHVGEALLGQTLTNDALLGVIIDVDREGADEGSGLELLEAVADDLTGGQSVVLSAGTVSLLGAIVLAEGVDTDVLSHVDLVENGGGADVEPVSIIRSEVLVATGLIIDGPLRIKI